MVDFVGRHKELGLLTRAHESPHAEFIPVYGRRRIGKSELILRFMAAKPGVYYLGKQSPADLQVREFLAEASAALDMPLLAELRIDNWRLALLTIVEQWSATHPGEKIILALDEFQWIAASSPEILSELQHCWDRQWKPQGNVLLIVCGSYLGFMERDVLGKTSPLFGRRTAQLHLQPFGYQEAAAFHPRWSVTDQARAYFLVGGVPQYLLCFDDAHSIETNIRENVLDEFSPLSQEPTFLLREELREVAHYQAILFAIASGAPTIRTIANTTGLPERSLHYYVQQLAALGYVMRIHPLDRGRPNPRQMRLAIRDALLKFWFRFVFPNTSILRSAGPNRAFAERIAPALDAWFGGCFEQLCREALPFIYAHEGVHAGFAVGAYWSKETQIDLVGVRDDNWTDLGECKWGRFGSARALVDELEGKVVRYPNTHGATIGRRYFVRRKPATKAQTAGWYDLDDLYALPLPGA